MSQKFFTDLQGKPEIDWASKDVDFEAVRQNMQEQVRQENPIATEFWDEQQKQKAELAEVLSSEIENGDIDPIDIDYESRKQILEYYKRGYESKEGKEYLVRGALLQCSCGTNSRKLNLSPCHGVYFKEHPLVHEMDCKQGEGAEDNITWFGVCDRNDLDTEEIVVTDDKGKNHTGRKCCPEIIGNWRNTYSKARIADNHLSYEDFEFYDALTTDSYLICRHGGIITPVDSGQQREVKVEEFTYGQEAYERVTNYDAESLSEEEKELEGDIGDSAVVEDNVAESDSSSGKILIPPEPGMEITISRGIDLPSETAVVFSWNAWSREYSVEGCNVEYVGDACCRRLNYAIENYACNSTADDLLMFYLEGYDEPVYAGAMVEGYADIGDIVHVTLDDGNGFKFLILDVKSTQHESEELAENNQCQCDWGHGYMLDEDTVQLQVCEFITAGNCTVNSVKDTESGTFLKERRVVKAQIVDHIQIED